METIYTFVVGAVEIDQTTARRLLAGLQSAFVSMQQLPIEGAAEDRVASSAEVKLKDDRVRWVQTLFGTAATGLAVALIVVIRPEWSADTEASLFLRES